MNFAASQLLNQLLPKLTQANASSGQVRIGRHQAKHIAPGGIALPAQQEIRAAEVKKRQRMALADLGQIEQSAKLTRRLRHLHRQQLVAGLGGGQQVAHWADATDAGSDARHLGEGVPLAEGLKAAILHHVETGVADLTPGIEVEGDLGVALNASDRLDRDRAAHGPSPSPNSAWRRPASMTGVPQLRQLAFDFHAQGDRTLHGIHQLRRTPAGHQHAVHGLGHAQQPPAVGQGEVAVAHGGEGDA